MVNNVNMCDIELRCFSTISIEKQFCEAGWVIILRNITKCWGSTLVRKFQSKHELKLAFWGCAKLKIDNAKYKG